jgi:hypothetical protein
MRLLLGTLERFPAWLYSASRLVALLKSPLDTRPGEALDIQTGLSNTALRP